MTSGSKWLWKKREGRGGNLEKVFLPPLLLLLTPEKEKKEGDD